MRSVSDHLTAVLSAARPVAPLDVVLADADGCVLAEDVTAEQDVPARAVADLDGYAVRAEDLPGWGETRLPVVDDAPPGADGVRLVAGTAILVAAGAAVPSGADTVVPLERTDRGRAHVVVRGGARPGEGVRTAGRDAAAGAVVIEAGVRLTPRHLALAAACGRSRLWVRPAPRVVVMTVGDELAEPGRSARSGRVPDADGHALVAAARAAGANAVRVGPLPDDRAALRETVADQLVRADLLLVAGGLGPGPWDSVGDVLAGLGGVRVDQVALVPGGRQAFGSVQPRDDEAAPPVHVVGVPGHPVAALLAFEMFVRPALRAMAGHADLYRSSLRATAALPWGSPAGMRHMVPVTLVGSPGEGYVVTPLGDPGQPSLEALARANALAVIGEDTTAVLAGDTVACLVLED